MTKHWYAVYTKPQQEQKVVAALSRKKIDTYCPLTPVSVYRGFGKKVNMQALFPSIVFVQITENQLATVRQAGDVINFLYWLGRPAVIPEAELKSIHRFTSVYRNIKLEKTAIVRNAMAPAGEVTADSLYFGKENTVVKLSLPSLGYILTAEIKTTVNIPDYPYESNLLS